MFMRMDTFHHDISFKILLSGHYEVTILAILTPNQSPLSKFGSYPESILANNWIETVVNGLFGQNML